MSVIGVDLDPVDLVLTKGRDFRWAFQNLDDFDVPENFPAGGSLYFEIYNSVSPTVWPFTILGSVASLKVESTAVDAIPDRCKWQLVFRPSGEVAGGDPVARGIVRIQS